eukprot:GSChrysophyteH1.ASY1.ANO1.1731.1 assembled CDS
MQFYTVLLALAVLAVSCLSQELEEGVLVLTDENFEKTISDNEFILVEFYAPWCGHCKSLAPEYAKAAQQLAKDDSAVKLAKLDATEHKTAASKHDVKGFPTLKFFRSGNAAEYGGGRTADEIVSWLSKKTGPVATPITSAEEYSHMEEANDVFVLGAFADTSSAAAKTFLDVAASMEPHTFAITDNADVKSSLGVSADTVVIVKTFDERRNDLEISNSANKQDIIDFVGGHAIPLVQVFSDETSGKIFKSPIQKHTLFFTDSQSDHHEGVTEAFRTAGKDFRGRTMMVNVQESQSRVAEYFGLKTSDFPAAIFADMSSSGGMKKYPMTADTEGAVTVVKGKSFQELVMDNTKDVLMEFYAPWCGHCKALAPEYEKLGEALKGNDNIVVGKMDSTANEIDVAGVEVKGFPTLYFFKGNSKGSPMKYEGGRTFEDMAEYIQKNAFNQVGEIDAAEDDEDDEDDENDEL